MIIIEEKDIKSITIDKRINKGPTEVLTSRNAIIKINGINIEEFNYKGPVLRKNARN